MQSISGIKMMILNDESWNQGIGYFQNETRREHFYLKIKTLM